MGAGDGGHPGPRNGMDITGQAVVSAVYGIVSRKLVKRSTGWISSAHRKLNRGSARVVAAGERCRLDWSQLARHYGHRSVSSNRQGVRFGVPSFQLTFLQSSPPLHISLGNGERGGYRNGAPIIARVLPPLDLLPHANASRGRLLQRDAVPAREGTADARVGDGEKGGCRESRIRPCICRENHAPTPAKTPFSARHGGSHRPNREKVLPPPPDFVSFAHVLHSQLLQAHPLP